ncbi:shikimate kinase [Gordonia sp. CPCC 205515]|uniref:shikimate kinase n=1 Tax=Gordonia sp. CPCC 205515 TaxID=3140791 RepID=UPI003AF35E77
MTSERKRRPVVVLIGFMGAGKSTVGRIVAGRLGVDFIDTDSELVRRDGRPIPEIFTTDGADRFREIERDVVIDVLRSHPGVIALGGGSVMTPAVADALAGHHVVYPRITADGGFARVKDSDRPLIAGDDPHLRYRELLEARDETYHRVGTMAVDAAAGDPEAVADVVIELLADTLVPERAATT